MTSLIQALLELSGGRVDFQQYKYAEEYIASENADLYALLFNITRTKQFEDFDPEEMYKRLSKSPVFSEIVISVQDLEEQTTKIIDFLCVDFRNGYLVKYSKGQMSSMLI